MERLIFISSDVQNQDLVNLVFVFTEKVGIRRSLKEVFVEDTLPALKVHQGILAVHLAIEVKSSAVFVLFGNERFLVKDRLNDMLFLPIEILIKAVVG